jgi:hypothetical protein
VRERSELEASNAGHWVPCALDTDPGADIVPLNVFSEIGVSEQDSDGSPSEFAIHASEDAGDDNGMAQQNELNSTTTFPFDPTQRTI